MPKYGYSRVSSPGVSFLQQTGQPWLEKPFTPEQVLELIARIEVV